MLRKLYPAALIFVSSILPRLDEENARAVECNKIVGKSLSHIFNFVVQK